MAQPTSDTQLYLLEDEETSPADGDFFYIQTDEGGGVFHAKKIDSANMPKRAVASTAEVTTGTDNTKAVTPSALNGSSLALVSLDLAEDQTGSAGDFATVSSITTVNPDSHNTNATNISVLGKVTFENSGLKTMAGVGHQVGVLGFAENTYAGTAPLLISLEAKIENNHASGVITNAVGLESQLSANLGTIDNLWLAESRIVGAAGNVTNVYGNATRINMTTGTVGSVFASGITDLDEGSGTIAAIYGLFFANQLSNTAATKYAVLNQDPDALIDTAGDLVFKTAGDGRTTITPESGASDFTHTLQAKTGTGALLSDLITVKTGTFERASDAASGTQPITGLGGKPVALWVNMTNNSAYVESSAGFTDGTNNYCQVQNGGTSIAYPDLIMFNHATSGTDLQVGSIDTAAGTFDSDGFTISWAKSGTPPTGPAETLKMHYIALIGHE